MTIECWQVHFLECHQAKPQPKPKFVVVVGSMGGTYYVVPVNSRPGLPGQYTAFGPDDYSFLRHTSHACFNDFWCFTANELGDSSYRGELLPRDAAELASAIKESQAVKPKHKKIICS